MIPRHRLLKIHRVCGLAAAVFILLQAITGCMLVYRADLARLIDPAGMTRHHRATTAPPSRIVASLGHAYPKAAMRRLIFARDGTQTHIAHLVDRAGAAIYVSLDPGDAAILRQGTIWRFPLEAISQIHFGLMAGMAGLAVVALTGLSILTLAMLGLLYWWPRAGRWRRSLEIRRHRSLGPVLRQFHRSLGVTASALILISALTGLAMAGELLWQRAPQTRSGSSLDQPGLGLAVEQALTLAQSGFPGHRVRDIRMPDGATLNVYFWAPERNARAVHGVSVDLAAMRVTATTPASADASIWVIALPIHTGEALEKTGRVLALASGLCLAILAISGPLVWLRSRRGQRVATRSRAS